MRRSYRHDILNLVFLLYSAVFLCVQKNVYELFKPNQFRKSQLPLSLTEALTTCGVWPSERTVRVSNLLDIFSSFFEFKDSCCVFFTSWSKFWTPESHGIMVHRVLGVPEICFIVLFLPLLLEGKNQKPEKCYFLRFGI